jgi:hypothetical protein
MLLSSAFMSLILYFTVISAAPVTVTVPHCYECGKMHAIADFIDQRVVADVQRYREKGEELPQGLKESFQDFIKDVDNGVVARVNENRLSLPPEMAEQYSRDMAARWREKGRDDLATRLTSPEERAETNTKVHSNLMDNIKLE